VKSWLPLVQEPSMLEPLPEPSVVLDPVAQLRIEIEKPIDAGNWIAVRDTLAARPDALAVCGDLSALYGEVLLRTGRSQVAREWLTQALLQLERRGERVALRRVMNLLGIALFELGLLEEAAAILEQVAEIAWSSGDDLLLAKARNNLGLIANVRGQRDKALTLYQLAVPVYQRLGSSGGLAECYHNMAITYRDAVLLDLAEECERRAIEFAREAGSRRLTALARLGRAEISLRRGEVSLAEAGATFAITAFREAADPVGEGDALRLIGLARTLQGKLDLAHSALETALDLTRQHGAALNEAETLRALAEWAAAEGNLDIARAHADGAVTLLERLGATEDALAVKTWMRERLM
jgi:tetratricopeptide (TPR) repeat protein